MMSFLEYYDVMFCTQIETWNIVIKHLIFIVLFTLSINTKAIGNIYLLPGL